MAPSPSSKLPSRFQTIDHYRALILAGAAAVAALTALVATLVLAALQGQPGTPRKLRIQAEPLPSGMIELDISGDIPSSFFEEDSATPVRVGRACTLFEAGAEEP